jgi:prepilin-type processing-associated H-X9-DG protein
MAYRRRSVFRNGLTLTDVCIVLSVAVLVIGVILPAMMTRSRDNSGRVKCASNLRQIGLAMILYANAEKDGGFPRTYFNPDSSAVISDTTGYAVNASFGRPGEPSPVGDNNVAASFFLALKTQDIDSEVFVCPYTLAERGFTDSKVTDHSNWQKIPQNMSYSVQVMFPSAAAIKAGWKWNNTMTSDFAIVSDLNPGGSALTTIRPDALRAEMANANSPNHARDGQNVLFGDGHVEFAWTPYCGMKRAGAEKDNIFTAGSAVQTIGGMPQDEFDSVMMPIGDAGYSGYERDMRPRWGMRMLPIAVAGAVFVMGLVVLIAALLKKRPRSDNSPQP